CRTNISIVKKTPKWLGEKIYKQSQELHNEDAN
ncbi:hypothetical protein ACUXI2_002489, partial [Staphylococcus capitis]